MKTIAMGDIIDAAKFQTVLDLMGNAASMAEAVTAVQQQVIEPMMGEINAKTGQQNDARYIAYMVVNAAVQVVLADKPTPVQYV